MLKHFVQFAFPGIFDTEYVNEKIAERDPELVTIPRGAFGYRFFDQEKTVIDGELLLGKPKNYSSFTYFGKVYTLEEVKEKYPEYTSLIRNMEDKGSNRVVCTIRGNWQILEKADIVIESSPY